MVSNTRTPAQPSRDHPSRSTPIPTPTTDGERIAGYRVLRRAPDRFGGTVCHGVVEGSRHTSAPDDLEARTSVTIVTFGGEQGDARAMRVIERLDAIQGECVPRILDVCVDAAGNPVVVLDFCGDALSSILTGSVRLGGGEVVTLAAPILASLTAMHDRGFAHGAVSLASIAVGTAGRPVLLGWEEAIDLRTAGDRRERDRVAGDDLRSFSDLLTDLASTVVDSAERERATRAADAIRSGADAPFSPAVRSADEVRLFEIADPTPVTFAARPELEQDTAAERAARSLQLVPTRRSRDRAGLSRQRDRQAIAETARSWAAALLSRIPGWGWGGPIVRWVRAGGRSRRIVSAGAVGLVCAVVAAVLLPTNAPTAVSSVADDSTLGVAGASASVASDGPSSSGTGTEANRDESSSPAPPEESIADDAVAGTVSVLDTLATCRARTESACWSDVAESGTALLAALEDTGDADLPPALLLPVEALRIEQSEDFGDARLVTVTPSDGTRTASVLMIRTEAGWRLREVFET